MRLKNMKKLKEALEALTEELEEMADDIPWGEKESESWEEKCQQKDEMISAALYITITIEESIEEIKELRLSDF